MNFLRIFNTFSQNFFGFSKNISDIYYNSKKFLSISIPCFSEFSQNVEEFSGNSANHLRISKNFSEIWTLSAWAVL